MRKILIVALLLGQLTLTLANVKPAIVSDSYGNTADDKSILTFADIPPGIPYKTDPGTYNYAGLKPLFDGIHGFVKLCFGEIPYDLILGIVRLEIKLDQETIMKLLSFGYGYGACLVVGLLFILIFPIVGCCFCCCRTCCKKCGGDMIQKRGDGWAAWRCCYFVTLFISCCFLGAGMICVYVTNNRISTVFGEFTETVKSNTDDIDTFAKNALMQLNYVAVDGYNFTSRVIIRDLQNIGPLVGGAVRDNFDTQAGINQAFDSLLSMDTILKSLIKDLNDVTNTKAAVAQSITDLEKVMTDEAAAIEATFHRCSGACGSAPDTSPLKNGANFKPTSMPDFSTELNNLQAVDNKNLTKLVLEGKQQFNNISAIVEDKASSVVATIQSLVLSFDDKIADALKTASTMLTMMDSIKNLTGPIQNLTTIEVGAGLTVGDLENYRWIGGTSLTSFVLLILVLQLFGVILGCAACCCCDAKDAAPTQRGGCSNFAGCLLMASVGLVFIFGALIMILVFVTYLVGAPIEGLICSSLKDPEYTIFTKLIDGGPPGKTYSTILGDRDGYTLGGMLFEDTSIPLTVAGLLKDCKADTAAFKALHLENLINLTQITDFKSNVDIDGQINNLNVDLSSLTIMDANTRTQVTSMKDSLTNIPFDGLKTSLSQQTLTADFSALKASLTTAAGQTGVPAGIKVDLNNHLTALNNIEADELDDVKSKQQEMLDIVIKLNNTAQTLPGTIDAMLHKIDKTQTVIQSDGQAIIKNQSKVFALRVIKTAEQYIAFVLDSMQNKVGKCTPIYNFYSSFIVNTVCGSVIDSMNGVWFSLGWCLFFMVIGLILSTKLSKHLRKMERLHGDDSSTTTKKNKVHPVRRSSSTSSV